MFARRREELEREPNRLGALAVRGDVTNAADLERLVERTVQAFGGIDIVVWNSGGPPAGQAVGDHRRARSRRRSSSCSLPAVRLVRLCLPHLRASEPGRVLCITSVAVKEPTPHLALSNTIRPGVTGWAKTLARELGPDGHHRQLRRARAGSTRRAWPSSTATTARRPTELAQIPLGRMGTPREFGDVVCFLASDRAAYVTGTTVLVDGGISRSLL